MASSTTHVLLACTIVCYFTREIYYRTETVLGNYEKVLRCCKITNTKRKVAFALCSPVNESSQANTSLGVSIFSKFKEIHLRDYKDFRINFS